MGFFDKIFGKDSEKGNQPDIVFGRFSDVYKNKSQYDAWDNAIKEHEEKNYFKSLDYLFQYIKDENDENLIWDFSKDNYPFKLYQGSKEIFGEIKEGYIIAQAKVAKTNELNIGFMRRLLEENYLLKYCRYSLDEQDDICLIFDSPIQEISPYKIYFALKELSVNADKQDDILIDEFKMLEPINNQHIKEIPQEEKEIKILFIKEKIKHAFELIDNGKLNISKYPGAESFILLSVAYLIDYLVCPQGYINEQLERIHQLYFINDGRTIERKNNDIKKILQEVLDRDNKKIEEELYGIISTFGLTNRIEHQKIKDVIGSDLPRFDWYYDNKHLEIANAVPNYIIGNLLFNFAVPKPIKELFHLYIQVNEFDYFKKLGFELTVLNNDKKINKARIIEKIEEIEKKYREDYPKFTPDTTILDYSNIAIFSSTFLVMIDRLDLTKRKDKQTAIQ